MKLTKETAKTVALLVMGFTLTVIVTGVIAFTYGVDYQKKQPIEKVAAQTTAPTSK